MLSATTDEHPFYVAERGWVEAGQLTIGDTVLAADGTTGTIEAVVVIYAPQVMYNLTVEWVATYLVGAGQWVVHNQNWIDFFTVQGLEDVQRLRSSGTPWPTTPDRAHLGPGVYTWDNLQSAQQYLQLRNRSLSQQGVSVQLDILHVQITVEDLQKLTTLDIRTLNETEITEFMNKHSLLYSDTAKLVVPTSYERVVRPVNEKLGVENYFNASIFNCLTIR